MNLVEIDNNSIDEKLSKQDKKYWIPLISGFIRYEVQKYLVELGFNQMYLPVLNPVVSNKTVNVSFIFNNEKIELTSSNALKLGATASLYEKVFTFSSAFRNEKIEDKNTHLNEFQLIEAEWIESDYTKLLSFIEDFFVYLIRRFNHFLKMNNITQVFKLISENIKVDYFEFGDLSNKNITNREEMIISDLNLSPNVVNPTFVLFYPPRTSWRAKVIDKNKAYIFNFLLPKGYGELFEASVRETNIDVISKKFEMAKILKQNQWYINALKYDSRTRVGFGMGLERFVSWLTQTSNIGETQIFPRIVH